MACKFRDVSNWVATPPDLCPALDHDLRVDVAVIGGGFTGLSAALELKAAGVDVVVLEMDYCGKGASGRNAGHLTPAIGKDLPTLVKSFGVQRAAELARFAERAVHYTEATFERLAIDCDYRDVGNIIAGVHPRHLEPLQQNAELASSLGVPIRFLTEDEMRQRRLPAAFRFGVLEQSGGHLHPGKYIRGLRRAALAAGIPIFEGTPVSEVKETGSPVILTTPNGSVRADKVVVATNAYTLSTLGRMKSRLIPLRVSLFRTEPLTARQLEALGWDGREGVYTAHESLESYRLSADNRLIGGSKYVQYGYGSKLVDGNIPGVFGKLEGLLRARFPEIPDVAIESFWGGWIAMTADFLPLSFGNKQGNLFYGMGYNGHGIAQATLNGAMLADQILGRPNGEVDLLKRWTPPLPAEPLRWLAVRGTQRHLERIDRAIDADLRAARRQPPAGS